jgi:hypothetical protein
LVAAAVADADSLAVADAADSLAVAAVYLYVSVLSSVVRKKKIALKQSWKSNRIGTLW